MKLSTFKKAGIYGGTFNPVHNGHLITALYVKEIRKLDAVIFVPANISPHKKNEISLDPYHRLKMLEEAVLNFNGFVVSDYEIQKGEISYTIDTLHYFKSIIPDLELIIGYDNAERFDTWKNYKEILSISNLVVLKRNNRVAEFENRSKFIFLNTPEIEISSSEIRNRVKNQLPVDFLVPDRVKEYISENRLYKI